MAEIPSSNVQDSKQKARLIPLGILWPFILLTSCFSLWGFANDVTNPMVKAFSKILLMSNFEGSLIQFAFYGNAGWPRIICDRLFVIHSRKYDDGFLAVFDRLFHYYLWSFIHGNNRQSVHTFDGL